LSILGDERYLQAIHEVCGSTIYFSDFDFQWLSIYS
jgi:hypothetical protein